MDKNEEIRKKISHIAYLGIVLEEKTAEISREIFELYADYLKFLKNDDCGGGLT